MYECHYSGRSSSRKVHVSGKDGTQAPQSIHTVGSIQNRGTWSNVGRPSSLVRPFAGWIQSTGHRPTQAVSMVPMQGSAMMFAISQLPRAFMRMSAELALDPRAPEP